MAIYGLKLLSYDGQVMALSREVCICTGFISALPTTTWPSPVIWSFLLNLKSYSREFDSVGIILLPRYVFASPFVKYITILHFVGAWREVMSYAIWVRLHQQMQFKSSTTAAAFTLCLHEWILSAKSSCWDHNWISSSSHKDANCNACAWLLAGGFSFTNSLAVPI